MIEDILSELKSDVGKAHEVLKKSLSKIRTGRANPDILDGVRVDYWGTPTPISQMATISVPTTGVPISTTQCSKVSTMTPPSENTSS